MFSGWRLFVWWIISLLLSIPYFYYILTLFQSDGRNFLLNEQRYNLMKESITLASLTLLLVANFVCGCCGCCIKSNLSQSVFKSVSTSLQEPLLSSNLQESLHSQVSVLKRCENDGY